MLEAARHTGDLRPGGQLQLNIDHEQHGIGSASCGPPLPAAHTLAAVPVTFTIGLAAC